MTVLLDIDGTLIDSNDAHARAWVDVGRELGVAIAFDEVRWLVGMGGDRVLPRLTGLDAESAEGAAMLERRGEIFRCHYLPSLRPFAGARALLETLRAHGHTLVVATSASEEDMSALLEQAGLADLIRHQASSDDAASSKPAPDIVEAALRRGRAEPMTSLLLGDTPYDVEAARNAGVPAIGVLCGGWTAIALTGARAVYADPADIVAHFQETPFSARPR